MKYSFYVMGFLTCSKLAMGAPQCAQLICLNNIKAHPKEIYLFAHGINPRPNTCIKQAQTYIESNIITGPCYTFDFNDGLKTLNFGQEDDCALFVDAYTQLITKHPKASIILVGISRGATTILNSFATHPELDWSHVKTAVLESPFARVDGIAEQLASSYVFFIPFGKKIMKKLLSKLPNYNPHGVPPIDMIEYIKVRIPLFVGYVQNDKTVPAAGVRELIAKLRSAGLDIESWSVRKGHHSTLGSNAAYSQIVRAFLKQHCYN